LPSDPVTVPSDPTATVVGVCADPEMYGVTVYEVMELLPVDDGARNDTVAPASFVIDVTADGADGAEPGGATLGRTTRTGQQRSNVIDARAFTVAGAVNRRPMPDDTAPSGVSPSG